MKTHPMVFGKNSIALQNFLYHLVIWGHQTLRCESDFWKNIFSKTDKDSPYFTYNIADQCVF